VRIPKNAIVADEKLTRYLLVRRAYDDKAKYLGLAGFTLGSAEALKREILELAWREDAVEEAENEYGILYRVEGALRGVNGRLLPVTTIWLSSFADGTTRFVTLKPRKEKTP